MIRAKISLLFLALALCAGAGAETADAGYSVASGSGRIESLNFADSTMVVSGLRYNVAIDAKVEIGGTFGAFTMLQAGMPIRFDYEVVSPTERRMVVIQELPPGVDPDQT